MKDVLLKISLLVTCVTVFSACDSGAGTDESASGSEPDLLLVTQESIPQELMSRQLLTSQDALVSLDLEEGSGSVAINGVSSGSNGDIIGGATYANSTGDGSSHSLRFDGKNDYIDLGAFDARGSGLTLATWFKADNFRGDLNDVRLISKATGIAANDHIFMLSTILTNGKTRLRARVRVNGRTVTLIANGGNLSTNTWYHAAMTHDGSTLKLYLNGAQVGSTVIKGAVDQASNVPVVAAAQPPGAGSRYFDGNLDAISVLQRALSQNEITEIMVYDPVVPDTPVISDTVSMAEARLSLDLEEGSAEVAINGVSSGTDGRIVGGASYSTDTPDDSDYSLYFDGKDDYIDLGAFDDDGSGLTLATWFKADSFQGNLNDGRLISKATGIAGERSCLYAEHNSYWWKNASAWKSSN